MKHFPNFDHKNPVCNSFYRIKVVNNLLIWPPAILLILVPVCCFSYQEWGLFLLFFHLGQLQLALASRFQQINLLRLLCLALLKIGCFFSLKACCNAVKKVQARLLTIIHHPGQTTGHSLHCNQNKILLFSKNEGQLSQSSP